MTEYDIMGNPIYRDDTEAREKTTWTMMSAQECPYGCAASRSFDLIVECGEMWQCTAPTLYYNTIGKRILQDGTLVYEGSSYDEILKGANIPASECSFGCAMWISSAGGGYCAVD